MEKNKMNDDEEMEFIKNEIKTHLDNLMKRAIENRRKAKQSWLNKLKNLFR